MATLTTSPATLQPCKHAARGVVARRCPPPPLPLRSRRSHSRLAARLSRARAAATGGHVEQAPVGVSAAEEGDVVRRLQNGPDVRGVALEGEKGRAVDLTPLAVEAIAESFGEWLREELGAREGEELRVSVGRDPRLSGPRLGAALFAGLARAGCSVFDMGLATTPACFMSTVLPRFSYDASIMVTALFGVNVLFNLMLLCAPCTASCIMVLYLYPFIF